MEKIQFRPLGEVLEMVQKIGFNISYAYDDLLFSEHNVFILRFDGLNERNVWLHFNCDCEQKTVNTITNQLIIEFLSGDLKLIAGSLFSVQQIESKEEIELTFL